MQPKPAAIGIFARFTGGYYFGAMLNSIHRVTRQAGVPLLVIQEGLQDLRLPAFGAEHVAGWIAIHPMEGDSAHLAALVATGVPVVTIATAPDDGACSSIVADNRRDTRALVRHLIDHGHRRIAYIDQGTDSWSRQRYQGYVDALHERGITLDPALILDTAHVFVDAGVAVQNLVRRGEHAARALIARGMPCTALVAGTDHSAIAAMQVLQAAGYRIPDDLAVVGFDDIADAQYAQPPLTTVRTRFDALARTAAEYMLGVLRAERAMQPTQIFTPTVLLRRQSCGCAGLEEIRARSVQAIAAPIDWHTALAQQLVQVISYPLTPEPTTPPTQIWPGVGTLIAAIDAALVGQDSSAFATGIEAAWQQAVAITENQELLNAAVTLLEDAAEQRLAAAPEAVRPAIPALFRQLRTAMLRARLAYEATKNQYLTASGVTNQDISRTLLSSPVGESQSLAWLRKTPATWGCLGLWADAPTDTSTTLTVAGVYQRDGAPLLATGTRYRATAFPPFEALPLPARQGHDLTILCPLHASADDLGVLVLCGFADQNFIFDTESLWTHAALLGATLKRDALVSHLEAQAQVLAQARDIAESANVAKSAFLANMSHELRTPLNGVLGYAQILTRAGGLNPQQAQGLRIIQQSGEHLLTLINDVLDLAKIEAGKLDLMPTNVHFLTFLEGIVGIIRARAETKRLIFTFDPRNILPSMVLADETRLRQVLLNLLGNAIKFTDAGQVTLRVSAECSVLSSELACATGETQHSKLKTMPLSPSSRRVNSAKGQNSTTLRFTIEDTGIGIAPDQLERIFQPFEQVGELSRRAEGTGLGLAISRQLVRLMGSDLHVESEPGRGSTFWFQVALPVAEASMRAAQSQERLITGYKGRRRSVLVVDDISSNRAVLVGLLDPLGFDVVEALDGQAAIAVAQATRPDLILMDRHMPGLNGLEAARQIRRTPELQDVPLISVSASVSEADQALISEVGYDAFLPKPIHWPRLAALLAEYLELEWEYTEANDAAPPSAPTPGPLLPPSEEELAVLYDLARRGDLRAIRERALRLEQQDEIFRPFASYLRQLAELFEGRAILALINQYREHDQ